MILCSDLIVYQIRIFNVFMSRKKVTKIKQNSTVIFKDVDGIVYIMDPEKVVIRTLNQTASFIWRVLKKPLTINQVASLLCEKFDVGKKEAVQDVKSFIKKYLDEGYLEGV